MHEFIIEIVKSDEIYRKIANASLEKNRCSGQGQQNQTKGMK